MFHQDVWNTKSTCPCPKVEVVRDHNSQIGKGVVLPCPPTGLPSDRARQASAYDGEKDRLEQRLQAVRRCRPIQ